MKRLRAILVWVMVAGAAFWIINSLLSKARVETLYAFTSELSEFASGHDRRLPDDWNEFIQWNNARTDGHYKSVQEWKSAIDLKWGATVVYGGQENIDYVVILVPSLKAQQPFVNDWLRRRVGL